MSFVIPGGNDNYILDAHLKGIREGDVTGAPDPCEQYGIVKLMQETSAEELSDLAADLPTDTHLVSYRTKEGATGGDAVRAYKMADLFDYYHDAGYEVLAITSGFGNIKPKLFVDKKQ